MSILVTSANPAMERPARPMVKGKCFICLLEVNISELSQHEKECLDKLQEVDSSRTAVSGGSDSDRDSDLSNTSAGSGNSQKRMMRCYICGKDFSQRFLSIHEKQCKRRWELGIIGNTEKLDKEPRSGSSHNLSKAVENERLKPFVPSSLRKAKSYTNVHHESKTSGNISTSHTDLRDKRKPSTGGLNAKNQAMSASHGDLLKAKERRHSSDLLKTTEKSTGRPRNGIPRALKSAGRGVSSPGLAKEKSRSHSNLYSQANGVVTSSPFSKLQRPATDATVRSCHDLRNVDEDGIATPVRKSSGRVVLCSICNRGFSMYSVYIHEKNCQKRHDMEQEQEKKREKEVAAERSRIKAQEGIKVRLMTKKSPPARKTSDSQLSNGSVEETQKTPRAETPVQAFQRCYICGNMYGSRSLAIHEPQCMKRWEAENSKLPKNKRKERPDRATSPWGNPSSPRLAEKSEKDTAGETPVKGGSEKELTEKGSPKMKECKICGKLYSVASLPFHEPKCAENMKSDRSVVEDPQT